jgi:hypothetical protein
MILMLDEDFAVSSHFVNLLKRTVPALSSYNQLDILVKLSLLYDDNQLLLIEK